MANKKQHIDDFLRGKMADLPNHSIGDFGAVESRMASKNRKAVAMLMLIPILIAGVFWLLPRNANEIKVQPPVAKELPIEMPATHGNPPSEEMKAEMEHVDETDDIFENRTVSSRHGNMPQTETNGAQNAATSIAHTNSEPSSSLSIQPIPARANIEYDVAGLVSSTATPNDVQDKAEPTDDVPIATEDNTTKPQPKPAERVFVTNQNAPSRFEDAPTPATEKPMATEPAESNTDGAILAEASQDKSSSKNSKPKNSTATKTVETASWSVLGHMYANYSDRKLTGTATQIESVHPVYQDIVSSSEKGGFGFNAALTVQYTLPVGIYFSSGVGYSEIKQTGVYDFVVQETVSNTSNSEEPEVGKTESEQTIITREVFQSFEQRYKYVSIPVHIGYQYKLGKKLSILAESGVSFTRFLAADGLALSPSSLEVVDVNSFAYRKNLWSLDAKVGLVYSMSPKMAFGFQPTAVFFMNNMFADSEPIQANPFSAGIDFNITLALF